MGCGQSERGAGAHAPGVLVHGLDDTVPNHSVLSKARKRWGQEVFVALFSRVVAQCVRAGLVEGTKIHADSSLVDANASLNSVRELDAATLEQIRQACREQTEKLEEADTKKNEADDDQDPDMPGPGPSIKLIPRWPRRRSSLTANTGRERTPSPAKSESSARIWPIY